MIDSLIAQIDGLDDTTVLNMIASVIGDRSEPTALITDYQNLEEF